MDARPRAKWFAVAFCATLVLLLGTLLATRDTQVTASSEVAPAHRSAAQGAIVPEGESTPHPSVFLPSIWRSASPTPIPPTNTPVPEWVSADWFCYEFPAASHENYQQGCVDDRTTYEIQRKNVSFTQAWARYRWNGSRMAFESDARLVQGNAHYHIFFNNVMYQGFYSFGINPVDRTFSIWRVDGETDWVPLADWTRSDHIHPNNEVNRLRIERHDDAILVSVNGQHLATVHDGTYMGGYWGFYVRNSKPDSIIHYNNIVTYYHGSILPTPTPTITPTPSITPTATRGAPPIWTPAADTCEDMYPKSRDEFTHICLDATTLEVVHTIGVASYVLSVSGQTSPRYAVETNALVMEGGASHLIVFQDEASGIDWAFAVYPGSGQWDWGVFHRQAFNQFTYESQQPPVTSSAIKPGTIGNRLRIERDDTEIRLIVNGVVVHRLPAVFEPYRYTIWWGLGTISSAPAKVVYTDLKLFISD